VRTCVDIWWLALSKSKSRYDFSFCLKTGEERRRVVHVTSSQRLRGSEAKDGRFNGVGCGTVKVGPNYLSLYVIFFLAHWGILVFCFRYKKNHRVVVGGIPLPPPLALGLHFAKCGRASCLREERRELRDLPNFLKSERMFGWFPYIVNS
jgi:hypothetical protein